MDISDIPKQEVKPSEPQKPKFELKPSESGFTVNEAISEAAAHAAASDNDAVKVTLAKCGMDCTKCTFSEEWDCPGCTGEGECPVYECCSKKGYDHCGKCGEFPCPELRDAAFDPETGDNGNRLMRLKALNDNDTVSKNRKVSCIAAGLSVGLLTGLAIGAFSGAVVSWIFAGLAVGGGIGAIISIAETKD